MHKRVRSVAGVKIRRGNGEDFRVSRGSKVVERAEELVQKFGSPLFVLDAERVVQSAKELAREFPRPRFRLLYSIKANPTVAIVERVRALGYGCDACTLADLEIARLGGCRPQETSLTGVGLSQEEISLAVRSGAWINVDSLDELRCFGRVARGRPVGLRIETGTKGGFHPHVGSTGQPGKLGIALGEIEDARKIAAANENDIEVLHTHLGSGLGAAEPFLDAAKVLLEVAESLPAVHAINLGGGLGVAYEPEDDSFPLNRLSSGLDQLGADFETRTGRSLRFILEPGEYLVAEAGFLATTVRVTKKRRQGDHVAIVDASANLLPATLLYDTWYPVWAPSFEGEASENWEIYGRTNQAGECLARKRPLPSIKQGDILVFGVAGAYTACRASQFNGLPRPAEVILDGDVGRLSRHGETIQDLIGLQLGHGGETEELHDLDGIPPRAREANVEVRRFPGLLELHSFVDDAAIGARVDLRASELTFEADEESLVAAAWAVVLAQHSLSEVVHVLPPVSDLVATHLEAVMQVLYDIRCACDRRALVMAPRFPRTGSSTPVKRGKGDAGGTLVLLSGGADSTLLLKLLQETGDRVEALHFRVNPYVEADEEGAAREVARRVGVPLTVVDIRMPGFERVGRLHSRSYGIYPYYNSIPHGRDLVLATIGALIASKRGFGRLAIGAERDTFEHRFTYEGREIYRADVVSDHGFHLLSQFLRECVAPSVELIAPLTGCSQYATRRLMVERFPHLFASTQSCVWGRSCGRCLKCLSTYLVQLDVGVTAKEFLHDMLNDPHNVDLESLVTFPGTPRDLGYENLYHYTLARMVKTSRPAVGAYWLRRFRQEKLPHIEGELPFLERACLELDLSRVPPDLRPAMERLTREWPATGKPVSVY